MGQTYLLIKPEGVEKADSILSTVEYNGFRIDDRIKTEWTERMIRETYPPENFEYWPLAREIPEIYAKKFGANPTVEAVLTSSEGNLEDSVKRMKDLVGPLDASECFKVGTRETLRFRFGKGPKEAIFKVIDGVRCSFYFNALHTPDAERVEIEKKIYF